MMVEDFTGYLKADSGIIAIAGTHVYAVNLPQKSAAGSFNPLPAIVYSQVSGRRPQTMEGAGGLNDGRYQFSSIALDYFTAKKLSEAVRESLESLSGLVGSTMTLGTSLLAERDSYNPTSLQFRTDLDFQIWHREPTSNVQIADGLAFVGGGGAPVFDGGAFVGGGGSGVNVDGGVF